MKTRLLCLGLLVAATQLAVTGCHGARWRAHHPCQSCGPVVHPKLHPIQTRRAMLGESPVSYPIGPTVPACHGCSGPGMTVGHSGVSHHGVPVTPTGYPPLGFPISGYPGSEYPPIGNPAIGSPIPIAPGPKVIPSHELPSPMPLPKQ